MTPREIALSICEPWFNGDPCDGCECHKVCTKLVDRIEAAIQAERVPETNFGNMPQPVAYISGYHKGRCIIEAVDRNVLLPVGMALYRSPPTSQDSRQVEPVAWMVYTLDGQSAFVTDNPADFTPEHQALPLYTAPPKREPLTDEVLWNMWVDSPSDVLRFARAIERAHGIGGEE